MNLADTTLLQEQKAAALMKIGFAAAVPPGPVAAAMVVMIQDCCGRKLQLSCAWLHGHVDFGYWRLPDQTTGVDLER